MKTWLITGASRGLGRELVNSALNSGANVVATGRSSDDLREAFGTGKDRLLTHVVDVADKDQARAAADAAVAQFGGIDVLVNNAGYGHLGAFEEFTTENAQAQYATNVFGMFNLCWAVLPAMRAAGRGHIFNVSSISGVRGGLGATLYSSSKHAVEGFSESLALELDPFGIKVTIIEPGYFRTDFFSSKSIRTGVGQVDGYAEMRDRQREFVSARHGHQPGDPVKLANIVVGLAEEAEPPLRFAAGSDAVAAIQAKIDSVQRELNGWKQMSISTDFEAEEHFGK